MNTSRHFILSIFFVLLIMVGGTLGYVVIEGWDVFDALYMTVITLSTVGYGEVHTVSKAGRIYTIVLILVGVGFLGYLIGSLVQFMVEGQIRTIFGRRRLNIQIERLKNHYIICGYGRIGRIICQNLKQKPLDLVVIERNKELIPIMDEDNVLYLCEEATEESTLRKAGIQRARGLVASLGTDIDNVFLILTARQLNTNLFIVARASSHTSKTKLITAGANIVETPYELGALTMAQRILRPTVTSFWDLAFSYKASDIQMEEIPVSPKSSLANVTLKDSGIRQQYNLIIIAIKKSDNRMEFNPSFEAVIHPGDTVIAVGQEENLKRIEKVLNPPE
ncbi:MAG: potassium channel protein [Deltaproteobacteria bacterium]|nr:potassium channel protein [Deltaproteobacteria bacterium]MBW1960377.1 potassium channel protein [Deltaproteobacteria bacterium]MBW1995235.1 potassium channel protein [Deltaproteobacteria bacterium]MBW2151635.1 potassium channel protein [Deltaproteobacteria bacterium]